MMQRLLLATCALLLAGCAVDADEGSDSGSQDRLAQKADFITRADRICRDFRARDAPLRRRLLVLARPGTPDSRYLGEGGPVQARRSRLTAALANRLRELRPPDLERQASERYLAGLEQVAGLQTRLADVAGLGERERYNALGEELNTLAVRTGGIAQGYGFNVCGASAA